MADDTQITIKPDKELSEIENIISKRARVMGQTTEQACTAMTIQILKSLRADTKQSTGKFVIKSDDKSILLERCDQYAVSFDGKTKRPCIRIGDRYKGRIVDLNEWWTTGRDKTVYDSKVYKVTLSDDRIKAWKKPRVSYMVCRSDQHAKVMVEYRFNPIVKKDSGIAKNALTKAMILTNGQSQNITSQKSNVINQNVNVEKQGFGFDSGCWTIKVNDNISYASEALKNGYMALQRALQKAANAQNAIINHYIDKHKDDYFSNVSELDKSDSPFPPEIKKDI